ncbi:MAG: mannose-1-phosphate guanylyltransferase [Pirellulales bacterium]|nr:mannose-1-phosphate guanylyltransferase [Pirellulales bacterium]
MLHAVIMAGGTGTRFWPESRAQQPKQLLRMLGKTTMIRSTVDRLGDLVPPDRVLVATTASLAGRIADELSELPREAILAEPCKRNTAPCIGLAAIYVSRSDPDATMAVMPADHVIGPDEAFRDAVRFAASLVEQQPERIVTFGVRPTYPAEVFGYIERGESLEASASGSSASPPVYRVARFREKPNAGVAAEYVRSGDFYWNSGIFLWKARTILDALGKHQPEMYRRLQRIADAAETSGFAEVLRQEFTAIKAISIDYAVMEHATDIVVVEASFDWDDLGSWQSLARLRGVDGDGNTITAKHLGLNTTGTIVRGGENHLIVTLGLKDCLVVHTPDATLVANKHDEESIRQVVAMLGEQGYGEYL